MHWVPANTLSKSCEYVIQKLGFVQKAGFPSYPGFTIVMRKPWCGRETFKRSAACWVVSSARIGVRVTALPCPNSVKARRSSRTGR